ncbi:MAG: hypothetical protein ACYC4L_22370 [Chloroflexota bacterium]
MSESVRQRTSGGGRAGDLVIAAALFVFLSAVYLLTTTHTMQITSDEGVNLALTENLAKSLNPDPASRFPDPGLFAASPLGARLDVEQLAPLTRAVPAEFGPDGVHYSKYGPAQALLAAPLVWLAQAVDGYAAISTVLLHAALVTAAAGAFVYLSARQLGYGTGLSLLLALLWGLASPAWVYTKRFMSEPLSALALAGAFYFVLRAARGARWAPLWAGAFLGLAVLNKLANLAFAPLFGLFLLLAGAPPGLTWLGRLGWRRGWARALGFALPVALATVAFLAYNWLRFGELMHTGYGPQEGFNVPPWEGLAGLLLSPGKSAFLYFPLLLLVPLWGARLVRRRPAEGLLMASLLVGHFLLYATWWIWWGGWNWGVRFLIPAWAFAVLLLGDGLVGLRLAKGWRWGAVTLVAALGLASFAVQLLGVLLDHSVFLARLLPFSPDPDRLTLVDPARQPILNQVALLRPGALDFAWQRGGAWGDVGVLGGLLAGVAAAGLALGLAAWRRGRGLALPVAVLAAAVVVTWGTHVNLQSAFALEDRAARQVQAALAERDERAALVYLAPTYQTLWSNAAKLPLPTWGRHEEEPLAVETKAHLEQLAARYDLLWVVSEYAPGDKGNGVERWLALHGFRQSERWYGPFRLAAYRTGSALAADFRPLDARFGEGIRLLGYSLAEPERVYRPGETVNLTLRWQAERPVGHDYTAFVHLLDAKEKVQGQQDVAPGGGFAPTSRWQAGEVLLDRYAVPVDAAAPAGEHRVEIGLYLPAGGERLPVVADGKPQPHNRLILPVTVQVGK